MIGDRPVSPVPLCAADDRSAIPVYAVVVDPRDADRIFVAADTVYSSTGRGDCVSRTDAGLIARSGFFGHPVAPYSLAIEPQNPNRIYVGTSLGLYSSADRGLEWEFVLSPEPVIGEAPIFAVAIDPTRSETVYAGAVRDIFKTVNGGEAWTTVNTGFPDPPAFPGVSGFAFDERDSEVVYLASIGLYKTTDGGERWTRKDQGLPPGYVHTVAVDWANPSVVYAGMDEGLFRSLDAAMSWQPTVLLGRIVFAARQHPSDARNFLVGTDSGVFRTEDGGGSWSPLAGPFSDAAVYGIASAPSDPTKIYAATAIGVFRSRDDGTTWIRLGIDHRVTRVIGSRDPSP